MSLLRLPGEQGCRFPPRRRGCQHPPPPGVPGLPQAVHSYQTLEGLVAEIELSLQNQIDREVSSSHIGDLVLERLKQLDEVAYVRFASVYREFKDINSFMAELNHLMENK